MSAKPKLQVPSLATRPDLRLKMELELASKTCKSCDRARVIKKYHDLASRP